MSVFVASSIPPFRFLGFFVSSQVAGKGCKIPLLEFLLLCRPHPAFRVPTRVRTSLFARSGSLLLLITHVTHRKLPFVQCAPLRPRQDALFVARPFPLDPSRTVPSWTGILTPLLVHPTWDGSRSRVMVPFHPVSSRFSFRFDWRVVRVRPVDDHGRPTLKSTPTVQQQALCAQNTRRSVLEGSIEGSGRWKGLEKAHAMPRMHSERG